MKEHRSQVIHVRVKPILADLIEQDAKGQGVVKSVVIRRILASHYESRRRAS